MEQAERVCCESVDDRSLPSVDRKTDPRVVQIGSTIEEWTFALKQAAPEEIQEIEASVISMVNDGPTDSFVEIRKRTAREIGERLPKGRKK